MANTGTTPLVMEKNARLSVTDTIQKTKHTPYPCYLCLVDEKSLDLSDTSTPFILPAGNSKLFALLTCNKQKDMALGTALRELYERKDGKCYISVELHRTGLITRQHYRSAKAKFITNNSNNNQ